MDSKDVLVIGAGISGCAVALALAKRDISVTILTSNSDERIYHAPFVQNEQLEEKVWSLQKGVMEQVSCMRATEQFIAYADKSVKELLDSHCLVDRNGNVDIYRCLQEQLKQLPNVEWINDHTLLELITLDQHSLRKADTYKNLMCIGVFVFNQQTESIETIFAKEIILATGGATSLFPYSAHPKNAKGEGYIIAKRAGARLLKIDQIQFHPLCLYEKGKACFPLPLELLSEGGQLSFSNHHFLEIGEMGKIVSANTLLTEQFYEQMVKNQADHLWLNLTMLDVAALKEKFPAVDAFCLERGLNLAKDLLPVAPAARYTCGGIAVDRYSQTSIQRLRAVGEVACSGLVYDFTDETIGVLESLSWAVACAEDLQKQLSKYIYYFPEIKENKKQVCVAAASLEEDWLLLQQVMWYYLGIKRDKDRLERGYAILKQLQKFNSSERIDPLSIQQIHLDNAIQTAILIAEAALQAAHQESVDS